MTDRRSGDDPGSLHKAPMPLARRTAPRSPREALAPEPAPPPPRRSRAARHPLVMVLNLVLTLALFAVLAVGAAVYWGRAEFRNPGPHDAERIVEIPRGASLGEIAAQLEERGVISNRWVFLGAARVMDNASDFQAGEYLVPARATMAEIMEQLVRGRVIQHDITVPEGLTSQQIVERLNENPLLVGPIAEIPPEGSLLPETYRFTKGTTRAEMLDRMRRAHEQAVAEAWERRIEDLPLDNPRDLVTLASIVEKETGRADERSRVAAVFVNRLRRGMKLQSDPTILYGLYGGSAWDKPRTIFRSDLDRPNPYNTYQISALPPGPIANPGVAALEAVANPSRTDDLYFVADGTGGHAFATTLAEHNRNVERWREIERQRSGTESSN